MVVEYVSVFAGRGGWIRGIATTRRCYSSSSLWNNSTFLSHGTKSNRKMTGQQHWIMDKKTLTRTTTTTTTTSSTTDCPFVTLGFQSKDVDNLTYEDVKNQFRRLAMLHHPDKVLDPAVKKETVLKQFLQYRTALDSIEELPNGGVTSKNHNTMTNNPIMDVNNNNKERNYNMGGGTTTMDPTVLKEIVDTTKGMSPGGLDKGGMWEFASHIRNQSKKLNHDSLPLHLSSSSSPSSSSGGNTITTRRRRRRK